MRPQTAHDLVGSRTTHPALEIPDGKTMAFASTRGGSSSGLGCCRSMGRKPASSPNCRSRTRLAGPALVAAGGGSRLSQPRSRQDAGSVDRREGQGEKRADQEQRLSSLYSADDPPTRTPLGYRKRSHLFVADVKTGKAVDLTPKLEVNTPLHHSAAPEEYVFSPDGKELAFTAEPLKDHAWSTNTDIWIIPATGGEPKNLDGREPRR